MNIEKQIVGNIEVFNGNSLEILRVLKDEGRSFDLLLTDPPYGIEQKTKKKGGLNQKRAKATYNGDVFNDDKEYLKRVVRPIIDLGLDICTLGIVTGGIGSWEYLPKPREEGCMYMPAAVSFNSWGHCDYRPIYYYGNPKGNTGKYRKLSHVVTERGFCNMHPCSKPLEFWKKLIMCGTDGVEGKTILDPFGGSGTTAVAAQQIGMKCTIIELNKTYYDLILDNLSQLSLF